MINEVSRHAAKVRMPLCKATGQGAPGDDEEKREKPSVLWMLRLLLLPPPPCWHIEVSRSLGYSAI